MLYSCIAFDLLLQLATACSVVNWTLIDAFSPFAKVQFTFAFESLRLSVALIFACQTVSSAIAGHQSGAKAKVR